MPVIWIALIVATYGLVNFYTGTRTLAWMRSFSDVPATIFWSAFFLLACSPVAARIITRFTPAGVAWLSIAGDWWLAILYYSVLVWFGMDLFRYADKGIGFLPDCLQSVSVQGTLAVALILAIVACGSWNARNPVIVHYDISIEKPGVNEKEIHAVFVSDIHLGPTVNTSRLADLARTINTLTPDIVLYGGDIIDENATYFAEQGMPAILATINPRLGSFAVLGNHEYIGGHVDEAELFLTQAGIHVLRDQVVTVADSFVIVGRDDVSRSRYKIAGRKPLSEIMSGVDKKIPIFLLDHQPQDLSEAQTAGVDLQLSGHTHRGQLFPNSLITRAIYEIDWGYWKKDAFQVIVSCGYGTWGPPIRVGNRPEIVDIHIRFK
jgi:predicted MPP superfamily phosphohydrolase